MKALKNYSVKKGNKYEKETEGGGSHHQNREFLNTITL